MCTPPCKPFLNFPSPRPPARIWLFNTTCRMHPATTVLDVVGDCVAWEHTGRWKHMTSFQQAAPYLSFIIRHLLSGGQHLIQLEDRDAWRHIHAVAAHQFRTLQLPTPPWRCHADSSIVPVPVKKMLWASAWQQQPALVAVPHADMGSGMCPCGFDAFYCANHFHICLAKPEGSFGAFVDTGQVLTRAAKACMGQCALGL